MTIPIPPRYQVIGFWLSMPFIALTYAYILYDERIFHEWKPWVVSYAVVYGIGYFSWRLHYVYDHYIQNKFPSVSQTRSRLLLKLPINLIVMTPSVLLILYVFDFFNILGYHIQGNDLWMAFLLGLTINVIFESLWEVIYIIEKYKESVAEEELIEQMRLNQEFNKMKEVVNPHFLFNCFNTLSSLIHEDKALAGKFLDELSKVYRYLLRYNEHELSTVAQETKFVESYARLLETRYGDGFKLNIDISPELMDRSIPSLTLQLLIENAVKHNVVSKLQPIMVGIRTTSNGFLFVENNLNLKKRFLNESTGIGLANIRDRYRLLNRMDVTVEQSADTFTVKVPLIK